MMSDFDYHTMNAVNAPDLDFAIDEIEEGKSCLCWVGHGDCRGCSGYPGILHEPACGWEWNPDCPVHT